MRIAVIIPVHEDREELQQQIDRLPTVDELIVVDSSSQDPVEQSDLPDYGRLLRSEVASRAVQQNLGAAEANGEVLVFLHADTQMASEHLWAIRKALENGQVIGGGFERFFASPSVLLRFTCRLAIWRGRLLRWFLGDQVLFVSRTAFEHVGGFQDLQIFEDYDFCRRLKRLGKLTCLGPPVLSSARRFVALGSARRSLRDLLLTVKYCVRGTVLFERKQNLRK